MGHNEEATITDDLRSIGVKVTRDQERVIVEGHLQGSIDGVVSNVPGMEGEGLKEDKTHSLKSFVDLKKKGVKVSKPVHYAQMQLYMKALGLKWALYCAVCKDDDRYHFEIVEFAPVSAALIHEAAVKTSLSDRAPKRQWGPSWWECKMCSAYDLCQVDRLSKKVNCRTCAHVTPEGDGTWTCARHEMVVADEYQETGCDSHVLHPDLVPWDMEGTESMWHARYAGVINGGPDLVGAVSSRDILGAK